MHLYQQDLTKIKEIVVILYQNVIFLECWVYDVKKRESKNQKFGSRRQCQNEQTVKNSVQYLAIEITCTPYPFFCFRYGLFCFTLSNPWYSIKEPSLTCGQVIFFAINSKWDDSYSANKAEILCQKRAA